jgi:tRNA threonylcarbamoyl adenosine modification protein YjeE
VSRQSRREIQSASEEDTVGAGRDFATEIGPGDIVLLTGGLGAGKTAFVRGLVHGLGGDPGQVSSPTFTIIQEYDTGVRVHHVDLYRLTPAEVDDLGLDELISSGVLAIEWPERWTDAPADAIHVVIEQGSADRRTITISRPQAPEHPRT